MTVTWWAILRLLLLIVNLTIKALEAIKEQKLINFGRKIERENIQSQEKVIRSEADNIVNAPANDEKTRKKLEDGSY